MRALPAALALACNGGDPGGSEEDCGTWASVGQPILLSHCAPCHGAGLPGETRHGAPEGLDMQSLAGARAASAAIAGAVRAGTMPPGGGLGEEPAAALLAWVECGAPGEENVLPSYTNDDTLHEARETGVEVLVDEAFPEGLTLRTTLEVGDADGRTGRWSDERYLVEARQAWLEGRVDYDADEEILREEHWDPPLLIYDPDAGGDWYADATATREAGGEVVEGEQRWAVSAGAAAALDPRVTDPEAGEVVAVLLEDETGGEGVIELGWNTSASLSLVRRWAVRGGEEAELEEHLQLTVAWTFEDLPAFPAGEGSEWMGRVLLRQAEPE